MRGGIALPAKVWFIHQMTAALQLLRVSPSCQDDPMFIVRLGKAFNIQTDLGEGQEEVPLRILGNSFPLSGKSKPNWLAYLIVGPSRDVRLQCPPLSYQIHPSLPKTLSSVGPCTPFSHLEFSETPHIFQSPAPASSPQGKLGSLLFALRLFYMPLPKLRQLPIIITCLYICANINVLRCFNMEK